MVQTDVPQLSRECSGWREALRSYRDEFNQMKNQLQQVAGNALSKEHLTDLERFQNQLHIQLINIHDLKQSVKNHEKKVQFEVSAKSGQLSEDTYADHEHLYDEYQYLEHTLEDLRNGLNKYVSSLQ